ncbi:MAG: NAD(P)H-binding protein [Lentisphaerae bacterium]|nr:NAD(P)H-binding protein [Lentisphaerota bacterium]MBT4821820.1 NAD(P)H-binding protein [Lentisphaerota bacterium]MBT5612624.1 NAD(P)H-binding protein [Lentisphaerota bacterium]MBT7057954.1 NAD(P)H-binding protein [Lentisphaerota bacterium]MBT7846443.1 NAD(P)H-binding protein [Lentisphaerota bacterium]
MSGKKALVLGGTGAMGVYLVPELASLGYDVQVVSLDDVVSDHPGISYVKADAKNIDYLTELLKKRFDVIVDFMLYSTEQFRERHDLLLRNTDHYIFLSSYRVYDGGDVPITENSPRLLDASPNQEFLATEDYSLTKARQEDIVQSSGYDNWTIVRPAITYSKRRFQLVTLEAHIVVARALKGLPVVLPREALSVQATMSWAGDVAKLFSGLILNPAAYQERFTLATAEHRTWGEIAEYYKEIIGLEYLPADTEDYLQIMGGSAGAGYQLAYDRLFERVVDNSKVLQVTGLKQAGFMPLRSGLKKELSALPKDTAWRDAGAIWDRMDEYAKRVL